MKAHQLLQTQSYNTWFSSLLIGIVAIPVYLSTPEVYLDDWINKGEYVGSLIQLTESWPIEKRVNCSYIKHIFREAFATWNHGEHTGYNENRLILEAQDPGQIHDIEKNLKLCEKEFIKEWRHLRTNAQQVRALSDGNTTHALSHLSSNRTQILGTKPKRRIRSRKKREYNTPPQHMFRFHKYLEILLVADLSVQTFHGPRILHSYLMFLMKMVNQIFNSEGMHIRINVVVREIFILEESLGYLIHKSKPKESVQDICMRINSIYSLKYGRKARYDAAVYLTRDDFGPAGLAPLSSLCGAPFRCTVNKDSGFSTAFVIAHELGHLFGLDHDGVNNRCYSTNSVMSPFLSASFADFHWSECSKRKMNELSNTFECLKEASPRLPRHYPMMPLEEIGQLYDLNHQCQLEFGKEYEYCRMLRDVTSCQRLWCNHILKPSICKTKKFPPLSGTKCAHQKWCQEGECLPELLQAHGSLAAKTGNILDFLEEKNGYVDNNVIYFKEKPTDFIDNRISTKESSSNIDGYDGLISGSKPHTTSKHKKRDQNQQMESLAPPQRRQSNNNNEWSWSPWSTCSKRYPIPFNASKSSIYDNDLNPCVTGMMHRRRLCHGKSDKRCIPTTPFNTEYKLCNIYDLHQNMLDCHTGRKVRRVGPLDNTISQYYKNSISNFKLFVPFANKHEERHCFKLFQDSLAPHYVDNVRRTGSGTYRRNGNAIGGSNVTADSCKLICDFMDPRKATASALPGGYKVRRGIVLPYIVSAQDGTKCWKDWAGAEAPKTTFYNEVSVCLRGKCVVVGCDGIVGSNLRKDSCGNCGGNAQNCEKYRKHLSIDPLTKGYKILEVLPAGALNIMIKKVKSDNILAIKNDRAFKTVSHSKIFQNNYIKIIRMESDIFYYKSLPNGKDILKCHGPLNKNITLYLAIMDVARTNKLSIQYYYKSSPNDPIHHGSRDISNNVGDKKEVSNNRKYQYHLAKPYRPAYQWMHVTWTNCTMKCGSAKSGYERAIYSCIHYPTREKKEHSYCRSTPLPQPRSRMCVTKC